MQNYEINEETIALIPVDNFKTKIIEGKNECLVKKNAYQIMEENCIYYGSSYEGRIKAAKGILNCSYKLPILVEESHKIIFFPTRSSMEETCCWVNYHHVKDIIKDGSKAKIVFMNDSEISFDVSKLSLENQVFRSSRLDSVLTRRFKNN